MNAHPTRRQVLLATAVAGGAGALAACSSSGAPAAPPTKAAPGSTSAAGSSAAPGSSSAASSPPAGQTSSSATGGGGGSSQVVAKLADVAVGTTISVKLPGGQPGLLTRTGAQAVVCHSAICTHQGCTVAPHGSELLCPCHGSVFDPRTGAPRSGPAPSPLPAVAVKIDGASVVTA